MTKLRMVSAGVTDGHRSLIQPTPHITAISSKIKNNPPATRRSPSIRPKNLRITTPFPAGIFLYIS